MATIYVAKQLKVDREVAVKILNPIEAQEHGMAQRFKEEARIISELRHPNTLKLIDHGTTESGTLYIVTELLFGQPLNEALRDGAMDVVRALKILRQVCLSLDEAHHKGIIHRDIKPGNIFLEAVGDQEIVKVLDFGIAKATGAFLQETDEHKPKTAEGTLIGTPAYMSPEQADSRPVTPLSDLYCLGVVSYQCLTGLVPFSGQPIAQLAAHAMDAPPTFEVRAPKLKVDPKIEALIMRMLSKAPEERPQSAAEIVRTIDALLHSTQSFDAPQPKTPPTSTKGLLIAAALVAIGGAAAMIAPRFIGSNSSGAGPGQSDRGVIIGANPDLGIANMGIADLGSPDLGIAIEDAGAPADAGPADAGGLFYQGEDGLTLREVERLGFPENAELPKTLEVIKTSILYCLKINDPNTRRTIDFSIQRTGPSVSVTPEEKQLRYCIALQLQGKIDWTKLQGKGARLTIAIEPHVKEEKDP